MQYMTIQCGLQAGRSDDTISTIYSVRGKALKLLDIDKSGRVPELGARRVDYAGLFLVALSTLALQLLLTRIFSVTVWYHFAFMAISLSMFGIAAGALLVYRYDQFFTIERTRRHLALSALCFGSSVVFSYLTQQSIPFVTLDLSSSIVAVYSIGLIFAVLAVPFVFSGICVCLALTRLERQVGRIYSADLAGAATGCVLVIPLLRYADAPTAVFVVAALACLGAVFFAVPLGRTRVLAWSGALVLLLGSFAAYNTIRVREGRSLIPIRWSLGEFQPRERVEKWNEFSRVIVRGDPENRKHKPMEQCLSVRFKGKPVVSQHMLTIDLIGATYITNFFGDMKNLEYLDWTITGTANRLRPNSDVLVVGVGGGQDILSALYYDQKSVTGVEINNLVIDTLTHEYADFSGNLSRDPRVHFVVDEGRSYIARQTRGFDIIQLTFIDTFAASSAGAFVLTENALYTVESFTESLRHLNPRGIFTVSHFYYRELPIQMYRMTALMRESLKRVGVENPEQHVAMIRLPQSYRFSRGLSFLPNETGFDDVGTFLVSRDPFSPEDVSALREIAKQRGYEVIIDPLGGTRDPFDRILKGQPLADIESEYPVDLSAPTDNRPFFFHSLKLQGIFDARLASHGVLSVNMRAVRVLVLLAGIVLAVTALCIVLPTIGVGRRSGVSFATHSGPLIYFLSIGFGFMFIEMALMQRLIIFLGDPTYALAVVLFALLLSSGLGSFSTRKIGIERLHTAGFARLAVLTFLLLLWGIVLPSLLGAFRGESNPIRIGIALSTIIPVGFFMGMALPLGLRWGTARDGRMGPWLWSVNGAASVCGSVLAVVVSLFAGITATFFSGFACYLIAMGTFPSTSRK